MEKKKKEVDDIKLLADIRAIAKKHGVRVSNYVYGYKDNKGRYCLNLEIVLPWSSVLP